MPPARPESPFALVRRCVLHAPEPRGLQDVLVAFGRIAAIGPDLRAPDGCLVLDADGARAIPGLVDAHVHLIGGGGEGGPASRVPPLPASALARGGVTTAVGLLGTDGTTRSPADLLAAVRALYALGLSAWMWTGAYEVPPPTLTGSVRRDLVLIPEVLGVGEVAIADHRSSQPRLDELVRLAADCHVGGMLAGKAGRLHIHLGDGEAGMGLVRRALDETELPPAVFHPTHANRNHRLWREAMELAARGVTVDVTASGDGASCVPHEDGPSAADAVEEWLECGLPEARLTVSSDAGGSLPRFDAEGRLAGMGVGSPGALAATLAELLRRGRELEVVLPFFTRHPATHLGLHRKGRLCEGADADLVLLDAEHRVRTVLARGRTAVLDGEVRIRGRFEP